MRGVLWRGFAILFVPVFHGAGKEGFERRPLPTANGVHHGLQLPIEMLQHGDDGIRVGKTDIAPHLGVAGGEARKVAEPTGGVAQDRVPLILVDFPQHIDEGIGQHMGQMAGGGQYFVMSRRVHFGNIGPRCLPHGARLGKRGGIGPGNGGEDNPATPKERIGGCLDATFFGAGDGMGRDQIAGYFSKGGLRRSEDTALGASAIGNDGIGGDAAYHGAEHHLHGPERYGDDDHIGVRHGLGHIGFEPVDDAKGNRLFQVRFLSSTSDDVPAGAHFTQSPRQRAANRPDPDDAKGTYFHANEYLFIFRSALQMDLVLTVLYSRGIMARWSETKLR